MRLAFGRTVSAPASEQILLDLRATLDEKFEVIDAYLCQLEG